MALTICGTCRFWNGNAHAGLCRRHAPTAGQISLQVARWPETRRTDGCGEGEARSTDAGPALPQACRDCVYWDRPGVGIDPARRGDHFAAWWQQAGWCRRYAPRPGVEIGEHAFWRVTHASDRCFDGVST